MTIFQYFIHCHTGQHKIPHDSNILLTPRLCDSKRDESQEYKKQRQCQSLVTWFALVSFSQWQEQLFLAYISVTYSSLIRSPTSDRKNKRQFIIPIREDLNVQRFADVMTKAAHSPQLFESSSGESRNTLDASYQRKREDKRVRTGHLTRIESLPLTLTELTF